MALNVFAVFMEPHFTEKGLITYVRPTPMANDG